MSLGNVTFGSKFAKKDNGERTIHWVPIESRPPSAGDYYYATLKFITSEKLFTDLLWYDGKDFYDAYQVNLTKEITAWAKLPSPYNPD